MATEQELLQREAKVAGQEIANRWMKKHLRDYDQSVESAKKIEDYLKANGLEFSEENLEQAFQALTAQGVSFMAAPVKQELPPLPPVPNMSDPPCTMSDINRMSPERYKKFYGTTHCPNLAFRTRVAEIIKRAKEEGDDYLPEGEE